MGTFDNGGETGRSPLRSRGGGRSDEVRTADLGSDIEVDIANKFRGCVYD